MAMDSKNLSVLAYSNGFTLWHYKSIDTKETVAAANYFDKVANIFNPGDLIVASLNTSSQTETIIYMVASVQDGVVTITSIVPASV